MATVSSAISFQRNTYVALGLSIAALIAMYANTAHSTLDLWAKNPLGHGYLVVPAAAYFAWDRRRELATVRLSPTFWALGPLALLAFVWLLGDLTNTNIVQQVCLVLMCITLVWGVLGTAATRLLSFSLGLLLFALPLADRLVPMLQDFTARFAVKLLSLSGVPVLLQQHVISIPGSEWQVAEACSGINYLTSSLAVGYVYAGVTYRYWRHRIAFVAASALVPLVANGIRVYGTILVAHLGGDGIAAGTRHYLFGWLVFAIMLGILVITCGNWREKDTTRNDYPDSQAAMDARAWHTPLVFVILALLTAASAPLAAGIYRSPVAEGPTMSAAVSIPWKAVESDTYQWSPRFIDATSESTKVYTSDGRSVKMYLAYHSANQSGVKLATAGNELFESPWVLTGERDVTEAFEGRSVRLRETRLQAPGSSLRLWSWYWVAGTPTGSDVMAKLLLANSRLFRGSEGSAAIVIATEDRPDANATLRSFLSHLSLSRLVG